MVSASPERNFPNTEICLKPAERVYGWRALNLACCNKEALLRQAVDFGQSARYVMEVCIHIHTYTLFSLEFTE